MVIQQRLAIVILLLLTLSGFVRADEQPGGCGCIGRAANCLWSWLPDDYVRKPIPSLNCLHYCTTPDDYCKKPAPCRQPVCTTVPDDYCKKCFPAVPCQIDPHARDCSRAALQR